jgi:ATP-dependent DNA helicase RecG
VEKIISLIKENPDITAKQIEEAIKLSRRGVEYNLDKLKRDGRLKRIGSAKGVHWQVIE